MSRQRFISRIAVLTAVLIPGAAVPLKAGAAMHHTECIVSLSPSATETLFAIGAGPTVVAVDKDASLPKGTLPSLRIDAFNPSAEAIASICPVTATHLTSKPSFVVVSYDANKIVEKLHALGVVAIEQDAPPTLAVAYHEIAKLGWMTSHRHKAKSVIGRIKSKVATDIARAKDARASHKGLTTYYELDNTLYSLTSHTFVGALMKSLGVKNVADKVDVATDGGYPQLSREYLIAANPKLVFLADTICCAQSATTFASRPGFATLSAVVHKHVVGLNDDVASRWGPRIADLMDALSKGVVRAYNDQGLWRH